MDMLEDVVTSGHHGHRLWQWQDMNYWNGMKWNGM